MHTYIGEIRLFASNAIPAGWLVCDGASLPVQRYMSLYQVIRNKFGGDGVQHFELPNLQGRAVIGAGEGEGLTPRTTGERVGEETHRLTLIEMPKHNHRAKARVVSLTQVAADLHQIPRPGDHISRLYADDQTLAAAWTVAATAMGALEPQAVSVAGAGAGHENRQPFLTLHYCIAAEGVMPGG